MAESLFNLPFGKYKGQPIEDVPTSYLRWLTEQDFFCDKFPKGLDAVTIELKFRQAFGYDWDETEKEQT